MNDERTGIIDLLGRSTCRSFWPKAFLLSASDPLTSQAIYHGEQSLEIPARLRDYPSCTTGAGGRSPWAVTVPWFQKLGKET